MKQLKELLNQIRQDFHQHPELGYEEIRTSQKIIDYLKTFNIENIDRLGSTGVVAYINGDKPGKTILLRADMDALKVQEENNVHYKSMNKGIMHACGHDVHMTWLLGAAYILNQDKKHISGRIKLLFQPAEEGLAGAKLMIEHGVLNDVDLVVGGHVWPSLAYKTLGIKSGPMMASSSKFNIKVFGKGGHGAAPHETVDPIMVASQIYQGLQTIRSRVMNPTLPGVVSVTQFHSGSSHNIIPDSAFLSGTVRTLHQEDVLLIKGQINQIVEGITLGHNASYDYDFDNYYPILNNDQALTNQVIDQAKNYFDVVEVMTSPAMAGEDFSFYANIKPSVFFFIGSSSNEDTSYPLHHPKFDITEDLLVYGSQWYARLALNL